MKLDKISYVIYADIESLIKKICNCKNNPEKSSRTKIARHIPCGYSLPTISAFNHIENKHSLYCRKDCVKMLCESLRENAKNMIDFKKKKNNTVNKKTTETTPRCSKCYICRKKFTKRIAKDKNHLKVETIAIILVNTEAQHIAFVI